MPKTTSFVKKKKTQAGISITSLMDVLTIILIFLLVNYSEEAADDDVSKLVTLPTITAAKTQPQDKKNTKGIAVIVAPNKINVNKEAIAFQTFTAPVVISELTKLLESVMREEMKEEDKKAISVAADKEVPYNIIDAVLVAAGMVGISQIEFMALNKNE